MVTDFFDKTSEGDYGTVDLRNINGGGHVFNWERKQNGDFALYESQATGEVFRAQSATDAFDQYISKRPWFDRNNVCRVYDMTNATPNLDHMAEDSVLCLADSKYNSYIVDEYDPDKQRYKNF